MSLNNRLSFMLPLLATALLSACGTTDVYKNPNTGVFTVASRNGIPTGGWDASTREATEKAIEYCTERGQQYYYINEQRTGTPGFTLLKSEITFNCGTNVAEATKQLNAQCKTDMENPALNSIRSKVQLYRGLNDGPPPFDIVTNKNFPNAKEKEAIKLWAKIREGCSQRDDEVLASVPKPSSQMQQAYEDKQLEFHRQLQSGINALVVALYQSKLTYGEFAQKRFDFTRNVLAAEREFRAAKLLQDREMLVKATELALQQQQNNIAAWNNYMQSVNARQPQTIRLEGSIQVKKNCSTTASGNTASTYCY